MSHVKFIAKFQNLHFWQFLKICKFDFAFFWFGIWCESLVWVIMGRRGVSQNAGILVVLVCNCELEWPSCMGNSIHLWLLNSYSWNSQKFLRWKIAHPWWDSNPQPTAILKIVIAYYIHVNSLRPSDTYMRQLTRPSLVQIMAWCLDGAKPLSEPMLEYCQLDSKEQTSVNF